MAYTVQLVVTYDTDPSLELSWEQTNEFHQILDQLILDGKLDVDHQISDNRCVITRLAKDRASAEEWITLLETGKAKYSRTASIIDYTITDVI